MPKIVRFICTAASLLSLSTLANAQDVETPDITVSQIESPERPQIESPIETSVNFGFGLADTIRLQDNDRQLELDNVKLSTFGLSAEKKVLRDKDFSVSAALSGEVGFGKGSNFEINGIESFGDTNYRRLQVYGDAIARYEGGDETSWTPFAAAGVGLVEERITQDSFGGERQKFQALTPKARFRAGLEKKLTDTVTFGISAGKTVDLD